MNVVCSQCGMSNSAEREYCSSCQVLLNRSPQVMRQAWEAARLRRTLSSSGVWSVLWGIVATMVGVASLEASGVNALLIGIGLFLIGTGIAAWASPNPTTLRLDAAALLMVGVWNILVAVTGDLSSQFMWIVIGFFQIGWAVQRFRQHSNFVRVQHIPKSLAREVETLINSVQRAAAERVEFRIGNKVWLVRLLPDLVVAVTGAGNAQDVQFVLPDEFALEVTGTAQGRQWPPAIIHLKGERRTGTVAPASVERYRAWRVGQAGSDAASTSQEPSAEPDRAASVQAAPQEPAAGPDRVAPAPAEPQEPAAGPERASFVPAVINRPGQRRRRLGWIIAIVVLILIGVLAYWGIGLSTYNRGVEAHNNLDVETALVRYEQVMRYYPAFLGSFVDMAVQNHRPCALYRQAHQAYVAQSYQVAYPYYAQFVAEYPSDRLILLVYEEYPPVCMACAQTADQQGDYLKAIALYREVLTFFSDTPQAADARVALPAVYCKYGAARSDAGDYGAATEAYQKALAVAQTEYPAAQQGLWTTYQRWGSALLAAGEYEMALARYHDALAVGDEAHDALVEPAIGQVYLAWVQDMSAAGAYKQAIDLAVQALEAFPNSDWQGRMLALIGETYAHWTNEQCRGGEYQTALDTLTLALQTFSGQNLGVDIHTLRQNVYVGWARALNGKQEYAQAIEVYHALIKAYPTAATMVENEVILAYYNQAHDAWSARDYYTAAWAYEELIKSYPTHVLVEKARQNLAQVHYDWAVDAEERHDLTAAIAHYEACLAAEERRLSLDQATAPPTYTITVNTDSLNVRRGPATEQAVIGVAKRGQILTALGRSHDGQWIKVQKPDGWVFASLVTGKTPVSEMVVFDLATQPTPASLKPPVVEQSALAAQAWEAAARVTFLSGVNFYDAQDYKNAALKFQAVIDKYALSQVITDTRSIAARTYLAWGDALSATARYEDAAYAYNQVRVVDAAGEYVKQAIDGAASAYLAWADSLYAARSYSDAIDKYALVYTDYPSSSYVDAAYRGVIACYTDWAGSFLQQGKYEQAIARYQAIVDSFSSSPAANAARVAIGKAYNNWGAALHAQKKYTDAMGKFALAWQATSDADVVAVARKGYNDALWALARLTDETGQAIINAALTTACQGQAAASPAVGLATEEAGKARCNSAWFVLPPDLWATMPAHFRYAVCMTSGTTELERCAYTGGRTLVRQQIWWKVTVRSAKTGAWLAENTFYGPPPGSCPFSRYFSGMVDYVNGGTPAPDSVTNWLRGVIK